MYLYSVYTLHVHTKRLCVLEIQYPCACAWVRGLSLFYDIKLTSPSASEFILVGVPYPGVDVNHVGR